MHHVEPVSEPAQRQNTEPAPVRRFERVRRP